MPADPSLNRPHRGTKQKPLGIPANPCNVVPMSTFDPHLAEQFRIDGHLVSARPFGNGNINDTFLGIFREGDSLRRYIHQRINTRVFANPDALMENAERITRHVRTRMEKEGVTDIDRRRR